MGELQGRTLTAAERLWRQANAGLLGSWASTAATTQTHATAFPFYLQPMEVTATMEDQVVWEEAGSMSLA
jgi:hypothetical protein